MPNWCNNSVDITGPTDTVKDIWAQAQTTGLLEAIKPIGEWVYNTAVEEWGTKWDVSLEGLEFYENDDGTASISGWFDSAWSPPINALEALSEQCVAELSYHEPGMCFVGYWSTEGGDDYYEYSEFNSNDVAENIPAYLVEEFDLENLLAEYEEMEAEEE